MCPFTLNGQDLGDYHVGLLAAPFDKWVDGKSQEFLWQRAHFIGGILLIVLLATTSLFYIATHNVGLRKAITEAELIRATEMVQLAAGIVHEIRNPMHAIRLNLYALAKIDDEGRLKLSPDEHRKLLDESNREDSASRKTYAGAREFRQPGNTEQ